MSIMKGSIGSGREASARLDRSTRALMTIDYSHHEIHSGSHYFIVGTKDLTTGQVLDFTWVMPDAIKWSHWIWHLDTDNAITWLIYENAVVTNALANTLTPFNSNRNSESVSGTTMKYEIQTNLTAANADTDVTGATLLKEGKTPGSAFFSVGGGSAGRESELVLKQNTVYCLRAIAGAGCYVNFDMEWYEHTDKS
jgi:hypothetical protein